MSGLTSTQSKDEIRHNFHDLLRTEIMDQRAILARQETHHKHLHILNHHFGRLLPILPAAFFLESPDSSIRQLGVCNTFVRIAYT